MLTSFWNREGEINKIKYTLHSRRNSEAGLEPTNLSLPLTNY